MFSRWWGQLLALVLGVAIVSGLSDLGFAQCLERSSAYFIQHETGWREQLARAGDTLATEVLGLQYGAGAYCLVQLALLRLCGFVLSMPYLYLIWFISVFSLVSGLYNLSLYHHNYGPLLQLLPRCATLGRTLLTLALPVMLVQSWSFEVRLYYCYYLAWVICLGISAACSSGVRPR